MALKPENVRDSTGTSATTPPLVVGVDGTTSSAVALEWAAREAELLGCPLQLVYAYPANALYEPPAAPTGQEQADVVFGKARERLRCAGYDGLKVSTSSRQGRPTQVLSRAVTDARMLVVGREHTGRLAELLLASTSMLCVTSDVAAPVTVVPMTWTPPAEDPPVVVVGVDGSTRCQAAVEHAFASAALHGARLVAVTAVDEPVGYPDEWVRTVRTTTLADEMRELQAEALDTWRQAFPQVDVETVVDDTRSPVDALAERARQADRVVIGGRGHGLVVGALVGSVARAVVRRMPCPVTVVHSP